MYMCSEILMETFFSCGKRNEDQVNQLPEVDGWAKYEQKTVKSTVGKKSLVHKCYIV